MRWSPFTPAPSHSYTWAHKGGIQKTMGVGEETLLPLRRESTRRSLSTSNSWLQTQWERKAGRTLTSHTSLMFEEPLNRPGPGSGTSKWRCRGSSHWILSLIDPFSQSGQIRCFFIFIFCEEESGSDLNPGFELEWPCSQWQSCVSLELKPDVNKTWIGL